MLTSTLAKSCRDEFRSGVGGDTPIHPTLKPTSASRVIQRSQRGLFRLLEGYEYAQELQQSVWDFAVEIEYLREIGLTNNELRWLVCSGFAKHAREIIPDAEEHRAFEPAVGHLTFHSRACFVLTEAGVVFVRNLIQPGRQLPADDIELDIEVPPMDSPIPQWDSDRQELRLGYLVVKRFKVPAPNQVMILAAFQEEGWPSRVDDPLAPRSEIDPKRRLHDTVNSLNRSQRSRVVHFHGDGSGKGICWELVGSRSFW